MIASDQAAIFYARSIGLEVHISTQLNLSNIETVAFYAQYADVVVLARELSLAQVRAIADGIRSRDLRGPKGEPLRIEMFAHGALCMAVSGKCYLSLHESAHSANRGSCRGYAAAPIRSGTARAARSWSSTTNISCRPKTSVRSTLRTGFSMRAFAC